MIIEEEIKIVEMGSGVVIGELAMMDPKAVRALSGMAKTDCIFLLLNRDSFDILVKVRSIRNLLIGERKETDGSLDRVHLRLRTKAQGLISVQEDRQNCEARISSRGNLIALNNARNTSEERRSSEKEIGLKSSILSKKGSVQCTSRLNKRTC